MDTLVPIGMVVWIVIAVLLAISELLTQSFFVMFLAAAALITAFASLFIPSFPLQILIFALTSGLLVVFTRPLLKKLLNVGEKPLKPSNISALPGTEVLVLEEVGRYTGKVKALSTGETWSAFMAEPYENETLPAGSAGIIVSVEGAKLTVRPQEEKE